MNQLEILLSGVLANPEDDLVRLAYADCAEEMGQNERAEFIRLQINIHKKKGCTACGGEGGWWESVDTFSWKNEEWVECPCGLGVLYEQERARRSCQKPSSEGSILGIPSGVQYFTAYPTRGFVSSMDCSLADWQDYARCFVRACPLESVSISDPWLAGDGFISGLYHDYAIRGTIVNTIHARLPFDMVKHRKPTDGMRRLLEYFSTEDELTQAVNEDALAWARGEYL